MLTKEDPTLSITAFIKRQWRWSSWVCHTEQISRLHFRMTMCKHVNLYRLFCQYCLSQLQKPDGICRKPVQPISCYKYYCNAVLRNCDSCSQGTCANMNHAYWTMSECHASCMEPLEALESLEWKLDVWIFLQNEHASVLLKATYKHQFVCLCVSACVCVCVRMCVCVCVCTCLPTYILTYMLITLHIQKGEQSIVKLLNNTY